MDYRGQGGWILKSGSQRSRSFIVSPCDHLRCSTRLSDDERAKNTSWIRKKGAGVPPASLAAAISWKVMRNEGINRS